MALAVEDWYGLYEVIWDLNGAHPQESLGEKYRVAERGVRDLVKQGRIELVRWDYLSQPERRNAIALEDVEAVLMNPASWYPEYDGTQIQIGATSAREKAVRRR